MTDATNGTSTSNELSDDEVRKLLDWCRTNPADTEALTTLNDMGPTLLRPSVGRDVIAAVHAILDEVAKDPAPSANVHAHMMILLATLLEHRTQRDGVDGVLQRWMRHPASFGPARATPPELQKEAFVQRVADALGWRSLSLVDDKDAIARLLSWVDTWAPKQRAAAGRVVAMMRRNFPEGGDLWRLVRVEFNRDRKHEHRGGGDRRERDRGRKPGPGSGRDRPAVAVPPVEGEAATASADGATLPSSTDAGGGEISASPNGAAPAAEGERKKRRRRRRKRKPGEAASAGAGAEGAADAGDESEGGDEGEGGDVPEETRGGEGAAASDVVTPEG